MIKRSSKMALRFSCIVVLAALAAQSATAGGRLETVDITAGTMTFPPFIDAPVIPIFWDTRCVPLAFTYFDDGVGEPPGAATELTAAFDSWNSIDTSFISMSISSTVAAPGNPFGAFDFVNEINFDAFGDFLAAAPSVSLLADTTFVAGMDIDLDGDPDVDGTITTCSDADGDGDIEFPPGFYKAGTILDNDIFFNELTALGLAWTLGPGGPLDVDVQAVAVHEFGHSHGLSHTLINQLDNDCDSDKDSDKDSDSDSDSDVVPRDLPGSGATMFPFIDINDPVSEIAQRSLSQDDVSWSSFIYPEGSAGAGPAALQPGDKAFDDVFGVVTGEVFHGAQGIVPLAGASVQVCDQKAGIVGEGFSGTTQVGFFSGFLAIVGPQSFHILDGTYSIPVPADKSKGKGKGKGKGRKYHVAVEAVDGLPAATGSISFTAQIGGIFGQLDFEEEFWRRGLKESDFESDPGTGDKVKVSKGKMTTGIDIITNVVSKLVGAATIDVFGFTGAPAGRHYAVRFPGADVLTLLPTDDSVLHTGLFATDVVDASEVPVFGRARLVGAHLDGLGNLVVDKTLKRDKVFRGQDTDYTPFFFKGAKGLAKKIRADIAAGLYDDVALIVELTGGPFPGISATPPIIGLDVGGGIGESFISDDGGATYTPLGGFDIAFELVATP